MEESTSMPMPSARPPRDMMLSDTPIRLRGAKVIISEIGIETRDDRTSTHALLQEERQSTKMASMPPITAVLRTSFDRRLR